MQLKKTLFVGTGLSFGLSNMSLSAADNCPVLNLNSLATAACSTSTSVFKPAPLGAITYAAKTPCPAGNVGLRKKLQVWFKGKKAYNATSEAVVPGEVSCTYSLDAEWKTALNTKDTAVVLTAPVSTMNQANLLKVAAVGLSTCPVLTLDDLKSGTVTVILKKSNVSYTFKVQESSKGGFGGKLKALVKTPNLTPLRGSFAVTKQYKSTCRYAYHIGKEETILELEGSTNE